MALLPALLGLQQRIGHLLQPCALLRGEAGDLGRKSGIDPQPQLIPRAPLAEPAHPQVYQDALESLAGAETLANNLFGNHNIGLMAELWA